MNIIKDPVYFQLSKILKELINSPDYPEDTRFLTEREVSKRYNVSRATANKAIISLVSEGLLRLEKGIGTFINKKEMNSNLHNLVSFTLNADSSNLSPTTKVIILKKLKQPGIDQKFNDYNISEGDICYYMERIRYLKDTPVIFERRHLFLEESIILKKQMLSGSLYQLLEDKFQIKTSLIKQKIRSRNIDKEEAKILQVSYRSAGIEITAEAKKNDSALLWIEQTLYRGDKFEFSNYINFPDTILSEGNFRDI